MNLLEIAKSRYSCRAYRPERVEEAKLDYILECVRMAPSAVNRQPVVFHWMGGRVTASLRSTEFDVAYNDLGIAKLHFELGAAAKGVSGRWNFGVDGAFAY